MTVMCESGRAKVEGGQRYFLKTTSVGHLKGQGTSRKPIRQFVALVLAHERLVVPLHRTESETRGVIPHSAAVHQEAVRHAGRKCSDGTTPVTS